MKAKQIAEATGKAEKTVRTWAFKLAAKSADIKAKIAASSPMYPADYDLEETCQIIEHGMGKNAADLFRMSANTSQPKQQSIADIVRETMAALLPSILAIVKGTMPEKQALALPPAEKISSRAMLRRVINQYTRETRDFSGAWRELYTEYYYRYSRNIRECAKNRGVEPLDYAESEGIMDELLSLAVELFQVTA